MAFISIIVGFPHINLHLVAVHGSACSVSHALSCITRGFPTLRHNNNYYYERFAALTQKVLEARDDDHECVLRECKYI